MTIKKRYRCLRCKTLFELELLTDDEIREYDRDNRPRSRPRCTNLECQSPDIIEADRV